MKAFMSMSVLALIITLNIVLCSSEVAGQTIATTFPYAGVTNAYAPTRFSFYSQNVNVENGSSIYDSNNLTLNVATPYLINASKGNNTVVYTLLLALTSVSYKASWQGNQPTELYSFYIPTPAVWSSNKQGSSNPPNAQSSSSYNLTKIPYGNQQIEVTTVCGGYVWNGLANPPNYQTFSTSSSYTLNFTVAPSIPSSTPTDTNGNSANSINPPLNIFIIIFAVVVVAVSIIVVASLLLYRRDRKTIKLS